MSAQEVPIAGAEPAAVTGGQPGPAPSPVLNPQQGSSNGEEPESSSPAEICVIIGESHNAQTPGSYVCGICGKKYKYYNCFQTHVRGHRESDGGTGEGGSQTTNNNFRYTCDICGKKYKYYSCFQEHRDLHAVDDPYDQVVIPVEDIKDDESGETFLKIGPRTGLYICEFCGKQYKYFNPYQEHVALHTPLSYSVEMQSPGAQQRLKDTRKQGNVKSDQIESLFSRKMEKKLQSSLGETNSSQNSSGTMCPLVSSSFSPLRTENENHTPVGTPKSSPAPAAQDQPWKRNSTSNQSGGLPEKDRQQLAERWLRVMCSDLGSASTLCGDDFLRLAQTLVDTGARHGAYPLQEALGGAPSALALRQLPRMYNQTKVKVTCALGASSAPGIALACHAHTAGPRPCFVLWAHQAEGPRLRRYVLGVRELAPGGEDGDGELQAWAQNVLSEFVMPEVRAAYVTEPRRPWGGPCGGRAGGPSLSCTGCSLGAVAQAVLGRKSLQMRGLQEVADLLDSCRHVAAVTGLPWDGLGRGEDHAQALPPAPPCWDQTAETLLKVHERLEQLCQAYGRSKPAATLLQALNKPLLGTLASLLSPLRQVAAELASDCRPTLQLVLPAYLRLEKLFTAKASEPGPGGKLCHCLLEALKENLKMEDAHQAAMVLDPQLKLRPVPAYQHDDIIARVVRAAADMGEGAGAEGDGEPGPPAGKRGRLGDEEGEAKKEVFHYLSEPLFQAVPNLLQYWRSVTERYPRLARLALWLLAVPAVGVRADLATACQQAVAMRGQQRVGADNMNKLVFLKANAP
ncbi:zinc finger protein 618-like isoform X1 [Conger conger]|uniref:zinc finger protein 618-like isoform X1 n=1 Tax=Conger conger TaxID=82655 RepID=UPI002A5A3AA4|nr:zinc finger protein 618-like isoform X1 [Conger conger]XP_061071877.1 zinc finger protein 618-like isoform X1 [Conger conger]